MIFDRLWKVFLWLKPEPWALANLKALGVSVLVGVFAYFVADGIDVWDTAISGVAYIALYRTFLPARSLPGEEENDG